jgi:hypothetical protein
MLELKTAIYGQQYATKGTDTGTILVFGDVAMYPGEAINLHLSITSHFYYTTRRNQRSDLNALRISSAKACGCSHAAKCPPFSILLK